MSRSLKNPLNKLFRLMEGLSSATHSIILKTTFSRYLRINLSLLPEVAVSSCAPWLRLKISSNDDGFHGISHDDFINSLPGFPKFLPTRPCLIFPYFSHLRPMLVGPNVAPVV